MPRRSSSQATVESRSSFRVFPDVDCDGRRDSDRPDGHCSLPHPLARTTGFDVSGFAIDLGSADWVLFAHARDLLRVDASVRPRRVGRESGQQVANSPTCPDGPLMLRWSLLHGPRGRVESAIWAPRAEARRDHTRGGVAELGRSPTGTS